MAHLSQAKLKKLLEEANSKLEQGAIYKHYKNSSKTYKVTGFAIIEATNEVGVLYQAQYGEKVIFIRPLSAWLEKVEYAGRFVPRFSKL
jgi:hypothetical protein